MKSLLLSHSRFVYTIYEIGWFFLFYNLLETF
nr:MAG TPA: hypothetical protein [Caudoviricetes sp.]